MIQYATDKLNPNEIGFELEKISESEKVPDPVDEKVYEGSITPDVEKGVIFLTSFALKWLRTVQDAKYTERFHYVLACLTSGQWSYTLSKSLKGTSILVFENKHDAGQRILWLEFPVPGSNSNSRLVQQQTRQYFFSSGT